MSSTEVNQAMQKITTNDLSAGGLLKPEEFDQFFQDVQGTTDVLNQTRAVRVTAPEGDVPRIDMPPKSMVGVDEGESAPLSDLSQPSVHYNTQKVSIAHQLTWEAVNETVGDFGDSVRQIMGSAFAQDLERVASIGDSSTTGFSGINDGWITIAETRGSPTYDHADGGGSPQPVNKSLFMNMLQTLDSKYRESSRGEPVFLMSADQKLSYKEELTSRNTGAGDAMLMTGEEPTGYGHAILTPLSWPDDQVMLTSPRNLLYIIQDEMRLESTTEGKDLVLQDIAAVMNMLAKVDYQVMDANAVVLGNNVAAPQ